MAVHKWQWEAFTFNQGYHIYKEIWTLKSGEVNCEREQSNHEGPYAVAIKRGDSVVGHVPWDIHKIWLAGDT